MGIAEYLKETLDMEYDGEPRKTGIREYLSVITDKRLRPGTGTDRLNSVFRSLGFKQGTATTVEARPGDTMVCGSGSLGSTMSKFLARFKDGSMTEIMFRKGRLMEMTNTTKYGEEDTRYPSVRQSTSGQDLRDEILDTLCRKLEDLCN